MRVALAVAVMVGLLGCDDRARQSQSQALPRIEAGDGAISGRVNFAGTPPTPRVILNQPCHGGAPDELLDETVVVNANGTLKNVFVYLEGSGSPGSEGEPPVLDQKDCRYVPHAVGVQVGQKLVVRSSDPTMHNVHYVPKINAARNLSMTQAGEETTVSFTAAEFIRVKCDVHPWMTAYIGVFESPFFAVTGEEGAFRISGVAAGQYTLVSWHERYGTLRVPVTVEPGSAATVDVTYKGE